MTRPVARQPSLRLRFAFWSAASITLVSVLLSLTYHARMRELLTREADARTRTLGHHLAANAELGVLAGSGELLASVVAGGLESPDVVSLAIYDSGGARLAAGSRNGESPPPFSAVEGRCTPCPEGDDLLRWVTEVTRRASGGDFFGGDMDETEIEVAGYLLMDVSTEPRRRDERTLIVRGAAVSSSVLVFGLVVALVLAQRLTAPLRSMALAARQIGRGDWAVSLPEYAPGELRELAGDFRTMATDLQRLDEENRSYRENLEEMVAKRTEELEEAYDRMKALNRAKDDFVATVSHDFRSPLAIILSMVQTVRSDSDMPPEVAQRFLGRVEHQCKRLQALVNDLLDLARIENRQAELATMALDEVIADQVELAQPAYADRGVSLEAEYEEGVVACIDRVLLDRALANLLGNALKFTPAPGKVTVRLKSSNGWARIEVEDTGLGIPEADLPRLFERFFQSDRDSTSGEGSGLGLAIVAEVMRKHRGRVEVKSTLGEGATFTLILPMGD
jgi:signal transduction histidine kinase